MSAELPATATAIINWYTERCRPLLEQALQDRVAPLDSSIEVLRASARAPRELSVCVLGQSGVGKSTLLNALVAEAETILPQGGIGPLTAQATTVHYAAERQFKATYQPPQRLNRLLFALERSHEAELRREGKQFQSPSTELEPLLSADDEFQLAPLVDTQRDSGDRANVGKEMAAYVNQACLLIRGRQMENTPRPYLLDGLRLCLGKRPRWETELLDEDAPRIRRVQEALARARDSHTYTCKAAADPRRFVEELRLHASGFLAPLIHTLSVGWDSELLRDGLVLTDLPGVGIANDQYATVTVRSIRSARAIILVVDRSGITDAAEELLRNTGFLNSLLHDSQDADLPNLLLVAVKIDLVATDERQQERQRTGEARPWREHFRQVCDKMVDFARSQLGQELQRIAEDGSEETRTERIRTKERILEGLQVHPVSAPQYRLLLDHDEDDEPPKIRELSESGIPRLQAALRELAATRDQQRERRASELALDLLRRARSSVEVVKAQWTEEERAADEAKRLREELAEFTAPLQKEFHARQGAFREFLRATIPAQIDNSTSRAADAARGEIKKFLKRIGDYHWSTLRAAVRRNGTYVGSKHVNLPNDLALRFEDPVAVAWSKDILVELRRGTRALGEDHVRLVGKVVEWSKTQGVRVQPQLVEALHEELKNETKGLGNIGKEAIGNQAEAVKTELLPTITDKVRQECEAFVKQQKDRGAGVKSRILDFLDELSDAVVRAAAPASRDVLDRNYRAVAAEIEDTFKRCPNPLETATSRLVDAHEQLVKRSDAQKRKKILELAGKALATAPKTESAAVEA